MASNRLKGITLEIGGDTTNLNKALSDVDANIRMTGQQLKDVQRLLKLDPSNIELLTQKQKLLTEQVKNTKSRLEELKNAQKNLDASGVDHNSAQYQGLQREIIATEQELKNLESAARQSNVALESIGATADKVAAGASKVAEATKGLSMAAAGAVAGVAGLAYNAMQSADNLNTLAQQTGFSTDELQKFQYASEMVDVSVESITGAAAKMTQGMASGKDAFAQLGVSITDANGNMRDTSAVFYEVLAALGQVENGTLRDQLAMEIFGKSANELAGIIDDGGAALRAYGNEAEQLGLIMSGDMLDGLNQANDAFDRLKAQLKMEMAQVGAKALEAFLPILQEIMAVIQKILTWVASLSPEQIKVFTVIMMIVAAISPIAGIVSGIASAVSAVTSAVGMLNLAFLGNPIVLIIGLITAAVVGLGVLIYQNADAIKAAFQSVASSVSSAWQQLCLEFQTGWAAVTDGLKQAFASFQEAVANGISMIADGWNTMISNITAVWQQLIGMVSDGWQNLIAGFRQTVNAIGDFFKGLANGVISFVESAVNAAINSLNSLISAANAAANAVASVFGGSVGSFGQISNVRIPRFAKGGSISSGTALVGEAGPELLTVNNGRATVQPLTSGLSPSFLAGLSNLMQQQIKININFSGSLAQLAAVLQPKIEAEAARRGISLLR